MTNAHQQIKEALKLLTKLEDEWQRYINDINPDAEMPYEAQTLLHTYRVANDKALALLETHTVTPNEPSESVSNVILRQMRNERFTPRDNAEITYKAMIQKARGE